MVKLASGLIENVRRTHNSLLLYVPFPRACRVLLNGSASFILLQDAYEPICALLGCVRYHICMKEKQPVAVFDIDGTIFRSSLLIELVEKLIERDIFPRETRAIYATEQYQWLNRQGDYGSYVHKVVDAFGSQLKGIPYADVADVAGEIIEEMKDRVYRYTRDMVKDLKRRGYYLLAISHSPKFIVDGFGYELGFDKAYGIFYTTGASECFTGEIENEDLIMNKGTILRRAVRKENLTLVGSVAVGDTESDLPMLELAETATAFNPNKLLYREARRNGWKVVVERKDVVYEI